MVQGRPATNETKLAHVVGTVGGAAATNSTNHMRAAISAALAGAARTPGEQLHYAFASVGCSAGSGTFPDLVHPTASILTTINEVARNLGGSEAKGQRCFDDHLGVMLNQSTVADGDDYEPLESKPGDDADFNDGLSDGFTIELWLTPMDTDSSSDQVLVALEQREPGANSIVCLSLIHI